MWLRLVPFVLRLSETHGTAGLCANNALTAESWLYIHGDVRYSQVASKLYMSMTVTNRVKVLRSDRGWTQEQLASAVGVSRQSINSIERDRYVPSLPLAMLLAKAFGCSFEQVFTLEKT